MKKFFTILFVMMLAIHHTAAQKKLYVLSNKGKLNAYSVSKVDFDDYRYTFEYGDVTEITRSSFTTSLTINGKDSSDLGIDKEVGICFSDVNETPTITDGMRKVTGSYGKYTFSICGLDAGTTYYYRAYVMVNEAVTYGDVCKVTTFGEKPKSNYILIDGHRFVDLGLPSGLLWATCNVGAGTACDYGRYFAWGETDMTKNKSLNDWDTYKYGTSREDITKYNSVDGKTTLDKEDDAAYVNWGPSCRMPTMAEFRELNDTTNCTWTWTSMTNSFGYSNNGCMVTSKRNGNSIFLPASFFEDDETQDGAGYDGYYWPSTLERHSFDKDYGFTFAFYFLKDSRYTGLYSLARCDGRSIRPVAEQ